MSEFFFRKIGIFFFLAFCLRLGAADGPPPSKLDQLGPLAGRVDTKLIPYLNALRNGTKPAAELSASAKQGVVRRLPAAAQVAAERFPLVLDAPKITPELLAAIAQTGALVLSQQARWNTIHVLASLQEVNALAAIDGVRFIKVPLKPIKRQQGIADSQADISIKADLARSQLNLSGAGIKIGVLSDSVNNSAFEGTGSTTGSVPNAFLSGIQSQLNHDLPASIQVIDFGPGGGGDEGAAMMELIHDIAPNATLAFAAAPDTQDAFALNVTALQKANCKIIVDDIGYADEPYFQDGPISQAITAGNQSGIAHFTAFGNDGDHGVLATYVPANPGAPRETPQNTPTGNFFHNWGIGGATPTFLPVDIPPNATLNIALQWNQPYQSFNLGAGSSVDLDLYIYDAPSVTANLLLSSTDPQFLNGVASGDPLEYIDSTQVDTYVNNASTTLHAYVAVNNYAGSLNNVVFRLIFDTPVRLADVSFPSGGVSGPTAIGHTTLPSAIAVGSIFFVDIDSGGQFGPDTTAINAESASSKGGIGANGIPFYFDGMGNPLSGAPQLRNGPDIAAPDGSHTSFFGSFQNIVIGGVTYDNNSFPSFFGTSAAAPVAAAVGALILERAPQTTPAQLKKALQGTALDIVASAPLSVAGPDDRTGSGLIQALAAVNALPFITSQPADETINAGQTATFSVTATPAVTGDPARDPIYQWQKNGSAISSATNASAVTATLTLPNVPGSDHDTTYSCVVSNAYGTVVTRSALLTVNRPPEITVQPHDVLANLNSPATFTVVAINAPLTYQWRRNNQDIQGATSASYTLPSVSALDDGAVFQCIVTNPLGSTPSSNATLHVNLPPTILSGPTATPRAAPTGQAIQFSGSGQSSQGAPATINWDFGDGTFAIGSSVQHAYASAQVYTVTMSATDSNNAVTSATVTVYIYVDANNDGIPDFDPNAPNESFPDTYAIINNLTPLPLTIKSLTIGLNFAASGKDTLTMSGSLPLPAAFAPDGTLTLVCVGGMVRSLKLNSKAKGVATPNGTFSVMFKKLKTPAVQTGKYTFKITKGSLQPLFVQEGLTDKTVKNENDSVRVTLFINGAMYQTVRAQIYTATKGKTGRTK